MLSMSKLQPHSIERQTNIKMCKMCKNTFDKHCKKSKNTKGKGVNCGGLHLANYNRCSSSIETMEKKNKLSTIVEEPLIVQKERKTHVDSVKTVTNKKHTMKWSY